MTILQKYLGLFCGLLGLFVLAVACGTEGYKVPVDEDTDYRPRIARPGGGTQVIASKRSAIFGIHSPGGWPSLPIQYWFGEKMDEGHKKAFQDAAKAWSDASGIKLFEEEGVHHKTGDDFIDLYSSLDDSYNGTYLDDDWQKTGKPEITLATTIWYNTDDGEGILSADIRMNSEAYDFADALEDQEGEKPLVDTMSLILHEMGHLLGLSHVPESEDPYSVMNPSIFIGEGLQNRSLSQGDLERIRKVYSSD